MVYNKHSYEHCGGTAEKSEKHQRFFGNSAVVRFCRNFVVYGQNDRNGGYNTNPNKNIFHNNPEKIYILITPF